MNKCRLKAIDACMQSNAPRLLDEVQDLQKCWVTARKAFAARSHCPTHPIASRWTTTANRYPVEHAKVLQRGVRLLTAGLGLAIFFIRQKGRLDQPNSGAACFSTTIL